MESVHDIRRVAAESTRVPDLHHRHERVPCIPCTPPTSTTRSRARTQALGEQTRDLLDLWHLVEHLGRAQGARQNAKDPEGQVFAHLGLACVHGSV